MKLSIFLMEDDEEDYFILSLAFSRIGLRESVTFFSTGNALMKKLYDVPAHEYPNLIGLDCHMPRYSGRHELILLKNHSKWQSIPVVLFSHNMTTRLRQKSMSLGALECLEKTSLYLDYMKLPQRLLELIALKNSGDEKHTVG